MSDESKASAYKQAGVDLDAADETVSRLSDLVDDTHIPGVVSGLGGFGGLFSLKGAGFQSSDESEIVLVSGTDGVGTKLELAFRTGIHDTIGIDCVAMCVNDVVVTGARPLFFLDYFATGKLSPQQAEDVVRGIAVACKKSGCALIGGETAEMPGFYDAGEYEIAGFCVGAAHRDRILDTGNVRAGQTVVGLSSTGVHSNGFSLVRKIIADAGLQLDDVYDALDPDRPLGEALLEPTALYPAVVLDLLDEVDVTGLAHITGGGIVDNLPRCLPDDLGADIDAGSWNEPPVFAFLERHGELDRREMYQIFNMGIGMAVIVDGDARPAIEVAAEHGFEAVEIGRITDGDGVDLTLPSA
jgi:phosphoribosylformylglycinamidine cyclo-ligase